ncbi:MAG: hypothetical protein WC542_02240 [Paludibacter sp.]
MGLPAENWKIEDGSVGKECQCGSCKQHWINNTGKLWPGTCSVFGCHNTATVGAHIMNEEVEIAQIAPFCDSCNHLTKVFTLKEGVIVVRAAKCRLCNQEPPVKSST